MHGLGKSEDLSPETSVHGQVFYLGKKPLVLGLLEPMTCAAGGQEAPLFALFGDYPGPAMLGLTEVWSVEGFMTSFGPAEARRAEGADRTATSAQHSHPRGGGRRDMCTGCLRGMSEAP